MTWKIVFFELFSFFFYFFNLFFFVFFIFSVFHFFQSFFSFFFFLNNFFIFFYFLWFTLIKYWKRKRNEMKRQKNIYGVNVKINRFLFYCCWKGCCVDPIKGHLISNFPSLVWMETPGSFSIILFVVCCSRGIIENTVFFVFLEFFIWSKGSLILNFGRFGK